MEKKFVDIPMLVRIHGELSIVLGCCQVAGLPQEISPEKLQAIVEAQEVLEKLVTYLKKQQVQILVDDDDGII